MNVLCGIIKTVMNVEAIKKCNFYIGRMPVSNFYYFTVCMAKTPGCSIICSENAIKDS